MRWFRALGVIAAALSWMGIDARGETSAQTISAQRDGSVAIAGRRVRCANASGMLDRRLPTLGAAMPDAGLVILNPSLLGRQPQVVRLFVFHHECGHHHVGASELGADCWAVNQGVRQGWLDWSGVDQVCRSFGNRPATASHPSGSDRCANIEHCLASALAGRRQAPAGTAASSAPVRTIE